MLRIFLPVIFPAVLLFAQAPKSVSAPFSVTPVDYMHEAREFGMPAYPLKVLSLKAALGEFETGAFAVHANNKVEALEVSLTDFTNKKTGRSLEKEKADLRIVEFVPTDSAGKERLPLRLIEKNTAKLTANQNAWFYLTLQSAADKDTGLFTGYAVVKADNVLCSLAVDFYVRPFRLSDKGLPAFGVCITPDSLTLDALNLLKSTGIESFECMIPKPPEQFVIKNVNGRPVVAWPQMDTLLSHMNKAGLKGPIILMLGNDRRAHLESRLCDAYPQFKFTSSDTIFGKKKYFGPIGDPAFDTLYLSALGQMIDLFKKYKIEMNLVIFDEAPERFMPEVPARYKLIHTRFPEQKIVGAAMGKLQWVKAMEPFADIMWIGGEFQTDAYFLDKVKKPYWFYCFITSPDEPGSARGIYGMRNWKYNPSLLVFWAFNYYYGDPFVEYDGDMKERDGSIVYPARNGKGPTISPAWIGIREAVDDWKYANMYEQVSGKGKPTAAQVKDLKMSVADNDYTYNEYPYPLDYTVLDSIREVCAKAILTSKKQ